LALKCRYGAVIALGKSIVRRYQELDTDFRLVAFERNTALSPVS